MGQSEARGSARAYRVAGAALILAAPLVSCKPDNKYVAPPPAAVTVAHPDARNITRYYETSGTTAAIDQADLMARIQGFLVSQNYTDGQSVKKGDLLFTIEPQPYKAKLEQAQAQQDAAQALVVQSDAEYNRNANLAKSSFASQSVLDQSRSLRDSNRANLAAAQANTELAQINYDYTQVIAPFDGVVTAHLVSVGSLVGANGPTKLATILRLDPVYVNFNVSDQELQRYRAELAARGIDVRSQVGTIAVEVGLQTETGYPHGGKIDYVAPLVDNATGTVAVRAELANEARALPPGSFVRVRIPLVQNVPALLVAPTAIGRDQAGSYVLTIGDGNVVQQKRVTLGPAYDGMRVVDSGLAAEDTVVVAGLQRAVPGEKVQPQAQTASAAK
jgi:RND family efflux transporter MFP subunit